MTRRRTFTLILALMAVTFLKANPVDMQTARQVAVKFVNANTKTPLRGTQDLQLVTTYRTESNDAAFHVFNTPNGFVIVAADDCTTPILGYSDEGRPFDLENVPIQLQGYLQGFVEQIQYGIENHVQDETTTQQWELVRSTGRLNNNRDGEAVGPLLTTQWGQEYPYNSYCPNGFPTGCTATAMAQIMNYWQYPTKGVGFHSYQPRNGIGEQSAWFNETYYQWDAMDVDHVDAIATLMYHVGVASDMQYDTYGSGAQIYQAELGVKKYFDYSDSSYYLAKGYMPDNDWANLVKQNLLLSMPLLYAGYTEDNLTGHTWVIDGFDYEGLFHMNFGWSGEGDGYFNLNNVVANYFLFNYNQEAVFGIRPSHSPLTSDFSWIPISSSLQYQFYDFSKGGSLSFAWYFGDGESSSLQNPVHAFNQRGDYQVTLIVSNETTSDTLVKMVRVGDFAFFPTSDAFAPNDPILCPPLVFDYDMDGKQDVFVSGYLGQQLYRNEGGSFSSITLPFNCSVNAEPTIAVVDLEKTNKPSILSSANNPLSNNPQGYYLKNNSGTLELSESDLLSRIKDNASFALGDYDGDGDQDLLLDGIVFRNNGNGCYSKTANTVYDAKKWIDFDGDGDLDLVGTAIYRNDGEDEFELVFSMDNSPYVFFGILDMADMDGNGKLDLIGGEIIAYNQDNTVFHRNDTSVVYSAEQYIFNDQTVSSDIDNDGRSDLVLNRRDNCYVLLNEVDGLQRLALEPTSYLAISSFVDYDGDNTVDLFSSGVGGDNGLVFYSRMLKNCSQTTNTPPSKPMNLWAEVSGNNVVLHWDTVSDDHSHYGSITYNLMVGTDADGFDIMSPLANVQTGNRYVSDRGNAGIAPLWKLNNLPNGTYYWRVQAIDNSLAVSQFSDMGSFVVNGINLAPELAEIYDTTALNTHLSFSLDKLLQYYHDPEGDSLRYLMVDGLPGKGHLVFNGNVIEQGQEIDIGFVHNLYYETNTFFYDMDTVMLKVSDSHGYSRPIPYYVSLMAQNESSILYVAPQGTGDGSSWTNAIGDLQFALDLASENGKDIWVAAGTYYGDSVSHNAFTFDNVRVFGGFQGNEPSDYDLSKRDIINNATILDGQHVQRTIFGSGIIDGIVLQNGQIDTDMAGDYGANVKGVSVVNSIIKNGESICGGGAAYCNISNSLLVDNSAYLGSAAYQCELTNCVLSGNFSWGYTTWWSTLKNCIIWNNQGSNAESTITYSAIQGEMVEGEGNISLASENDGHDPNANYVRFVDPENGDFRLSCGSACINMGTPDISELGLPLVDLQGNPRVMDGRIDMGAYEFDPETECPETIVQTLELTPGWNWISTYIEADDPVALLQMLESALGDNASQISSAELFTENDGGEWWGELDEVGLTNEQMYMVLVETPYTVELQGLPANPASHSITINPGWNWIGFPSDHQMSIEEALGGFDAEEGDVFANSEMFTEFEDGEWFGDVAILIPGQGFMYYSNSTEPKMLVIGGSKARR